MKLRWTLMFLFVILSASSGISQTKYYFDYDYFYVTEDGIIRQKGLVG